MAKKELIHITTHTGKMAMIRSISTTCLDNVLCKARMKQGKTICAHCFSVSVQKRYSNVTKALRRNTELLTSSILPIEALPSLNDRYFRLESFGDLNNEIQVINFFNICHKNEDTDFALWTKNPWFIKKAIDMGYEKPKNLNIIFSSIFTNEVNLAFAKRYDFINAIFTVYTKEYAEENGVEINCGARDCWSCKRCYKHMEDGKLTIINELQK